MAKRWILLAMPPLMIWGALGCGHSKDIGGLDVIYDKTAPNLTEEREQVIQVMLTCYPQAELSRQAVYFDIYHFSP
ncbi:MAG: hypothetical protein IPJ46_01015, partial [Anaerolineales bacterium]|nr:hypothetical protein [Anaerolineales bacterium]